MVNQMRAHNRLRQRPRVIEADAYQMKPRPEGPGVSRPGRGAGNAIVKDMSAKGAALTGTIVPRLQRSVLDTSTTA